MRWLIFSTTVLTLLSGTTFALQGKVDVGYTMIHVDVINSGEPEKDLQLWGGAANATVNLVHCLCIKPNFLYAQGDADYYSTGAALGAYLPFWDCFSVMPYAGAGYSHMKFFIDLPVLGQFNLRQHFRTVSYLVGIDLQWKPIPCFSLSGSVQFAWAEIRTTIDTIIRTDAQSKGFNYFAQADYYVLPCVSINASVAYLTARSKERHGSDALGYRVGLGYLF